MKKNKILFLGIIIATSMVSCSKDDDSAKGLPEQLLGKWTLVEDMTLDVNDNIIDKFMDTPTPCPIDYFDFKAGGIVVDYYNEYYNNTCQEYKIDEKYKLEGNTLTFEYTNGDLDPYSIKIVGETLEMVSPLNERNELDYNSNVAKLKSVYKKL